MGLCPFPVMPRKSEADEMSQSRSNQHIPFVGLVLSGTLIALYADSRIEAAELPEKFGPILKNLQSTDQKKQLAGIAELRAMGSDAIEMGAALVQIGIMSNNAKVREAAMDAVAKIDPEVSKQVAIILNDKSEENRDKAVLTLSKMGNSAKSAAPAIKYHALYVASRNLQNSAKNPQYEAFEMIVLLSKIDPDDPTVSEMAMRAVAGYDKNIRLRRTGTETFRNEAITLFNSLKVDKNKKCSAIMLGISQTTVDKVLLINELGNLGEDASPAVKLLNRLKGDLDPKVHAAAEAALGKIGK
jgi:hypothetical protein